MCVCPFFNDRTDTPTRSKSLRSHPYADAMCWLGRWALLHSKRWLGFLNALSPLSAAERRPNVNNARQEAEGNEACLDFWGAFSAFISLCSASNHLSVSSWLTPPPPLKPRSLIYSAAPVGLTVCACVFVCVICRWVVLTLRNGFGRWWWLGERDVHREYATCKWLKCAAAEAAASLCLAGLRLQALPFWCCGGVSVFWLLNGLGGERQADDRPIQTWWVWCDRKHVEDDAAASLCREEVKKKNIDLCVRQLVLGGSAAGQSTTTAS